MKSTLKNHMKAQHRDALGALPTWHSNCHAVAGVCRPGKTARDRVPRDKR